VLCADGACATLAGHGLPRCAVASRVRSDAALFDPPPPTTGKRLPAPPKLAARAKAWQEVELTCEMRRRRGSSGQTRALVPGLPRGTRPSRRRARPGEDRARRLPLLHHRPPDGTKRGGRDLPPAAGRWSIEVCYRQVKQDLGGQWPQSWKDKGPERAAGLSFLLYGAIWIWYITVSGDRQRFSATPRYPEKRLLRRRPRRARSGAMARANICILWGASDKRGNCHSIDRGPRSGCVVVCVRLRPATQRRKGDRYST